MPMAKLVASRLKLRHVRLQDRLARHLPKDAAITFAALLPFPQLLTANVGDEVRLVPALLGADAAGKEIGCAVVSLVEFERQIIDEREAAEELQHERERCDRHQARRLRRIGIEVPVRLVDRYREQAS